MVYGEIPCQICGVSFNIGRIRRADEPDEDAWSSYFWPFYLVREKPWYPGGTIRDCNESTGCTFAVRKLPNPWGDSHLDTIGDDDEDDSTYSDRSAVEEDPLEYDSEADSDHDVAMPDMGDAEEQASTTKAYLPLMIPTPCLKSFYGWSKSYLCLQYLQASRKFGGLTDDEEYLEFNRYLGGRGTEVESYVPQRLRRLSEYSVPADHHGDTFIMPSVYKDREHALVHSRLVKGDSEHIAGPLCENSYGYHGHQISAAEMRGCRTFQFLVRKDDSWAQEEDDQNFERSSMYFLSGIGDSMPDWDSYIRIDQLPVRHGRPVPPTDQFNFPDDDADKALKRPMPFHPACLEVFLQASYHNHGHADIDALMALFLYEAGTDENLQNTTAFNIPRHPAVVQSYPEPDEPWQHWRGTDWLAANPIYIPALKPILYAAVQPPDSMLDTRDSPFYPLSGTASAANSRTLDPFAKLPQELKLQILLYLDTRDIANLRLASRACHWLPNTLWYHLLRRDMPWLWEIWPEDQMASNTPYYWTGVSYTELMVRQQMREEYDWWIQHYRQAIKDEMPGRYEEWCNAEPSFEDLVPPLPGPEPYFKPPRERTDWYHLYCDITRNWSQLGGLQNRKRIWNDVHNLFMRIDELQLTPRPEELLEGIDHGTSTLKPFRVGATNPCIRFVVQGNN